MAAIEATAEAVTSTTKEVLEGVPVLVEETLTILADKFGTTGEHLWGVLVQYYVSRGYIEFLIVAILIGFIGGVSMVCRKRNEITSDRDGRAAIAIITWVLTGIMSIVCIFRLVFGILYLCNPEYYALREIMGYF